MNKTEANQLNQVAKRLFTSHYDGCHYSDPDNCGACALTIGNTSPNYAGWARVYVEGERPIPESWRMDFYDELCSENEAYRKKLEESVKWFGVRWQ